MLRVCGGGTIQERLGCWLECDFGDGVPLRDFVSAQGADQVCDFVQDFATCYLLDMWCFAKSLWRGGGGERLPGAGGLCRAVGPGLLTQTFRLPHCNLQGKRAIWTRSKPSRSTSIHNIPKRANFIRNSQLDRLDREHLEHPQNDPKSYM